MIDIYIALSIHNTNTFIVATRKYYNMEDKEVGDKIIINSHEFIVARKSNNLVKLLIPELLGNGICTSGVSKKSISDADKIYDYFNDLKTDGWEINNDSFVKRHKIKLNDPAVSATADVTGQTDVANSGQTDVTTAVAVKLPARLGRNQKKYLELIEQNKSQDEIKSDDFFLNLSFRKWNDLIESLRRYGLIDISYNQYRNQPEHHHQGARRHKGDKHE